MEPETTEELPTPEDPKTAVLAAQLQGVIEVREERLLDGLGRQIALLAETPDRSVAAKINPDGPVEPVRPDGRVVSRNQPMDNLYRTLLRAKPQFKGARDPDQDHWNNQWLVGLRTHDIPLQKLATVKADEAYARANFDRATLLSGDLDVSDPTAITQGSASSLMPQSFANVVEIAKQQAAVLGPLCTNFTTSGNTLRVPTVAAVTAVTAAEGAAPAEANPTVASIMLIPHKMGARIILSDEVLSDSAFNVMQIMGSRVGQGIGLLEDTQILTTDGTAPNLTGALIGGVVTSATTTVLVAADLATLFFALGKAYQNNGTWLCATLVATLLTNLVDGNGNQVLQNGTNARGPVTDVNTPSSIGTIFGRPVFVVPATGGDLIFGDLSSYAIVRKGGIEAKASSDVGFATDTTQFKFTQRIDGEMIDTAGIKEIPASAT